MKFITLVSVLCLPLVAFATGQSVPAVSDINLVAADRCGANTNGGPTVECGLNTTVNFTAHPGGECHHFTAILGTTSTDDGILTIYDYEEGNCSGHEVSESPQSVDIQNSANATGAIHLQNALYVKKVNPPKGS